MNQQEYFKNVQNHTAKKVQIVNNFGPPMALIKVPMNVIDGLVKTTDRILGTKYDSHGDRLVGQIKHEAALTVDDLDESGAAYFFYGCALFYIQNVLRQSLTHSSNNEELQRDYDINVMYNTAWTVSQYENEYNPVHFHTGSEISSVCYLKIPEYKKRWGNDRKDKTNSCDGAIEFIHHASQVNSLETGTKRYTPEVGDLFLFPASLLHTVYPFLGDGERRSLAFNMSYQVRNKKTGLVSNGYPDRVVMNPDIGMASTEIPKEYFKENWRENATPSSKMKEME